jgi:hypothetical protein
MNRVETRSAVTTLALLLGLLTGCGGVSIRPDSLVERGYERVALGSREPSGRWHENPNYELWVKESREGARNVHACLVPRQEEYQWKLVLHVANKEAWSRESPVRIRGMDCIVSGPLPDGALNYTVSFTYWQ